MGQLREGPEAVLALGLRDRLVVVLGRPALDLRAVLLEQRRCRGAGTRRRACASRPAGASRSGTRRRRPSRAARRSRSLNPRSRPPIAKLATRRLTSHSNGPGWVSSKSLMSKIRRRSGAAKTPKLERCASPQSWTMRSVSWRGGKVRGHDSRGASIEGEGRRAHPPVPDRDELLDAGLVLALEDLDRIGALGGRLPGSKRRAGSLATRRLSLRLALARGQESQPWDTSWSRPRSRARSTASPREVASSLR